MTIKQFELELKEINENINIRPSAVSDMNGIYYKDVYICGIPSDNIYEEVRYEYKNEMGTPHKTSTVAKGQVENWLSRIDEMLEIEKDFNESEKLINNKDEKLTNTGEVNKDSEDVKPIAEPEDRKEQPEDLPTSEEVS
jgi:hypothetical protein